MEDAARQEHDQTTSGSFGRRQRLEATLYEVLALLRYRERAEPASHPYRSKPALAPGESVGAALARHLRSLLPRLGVLTGVCALLGLAGHVESRVRPRLEKPLSAIRSPLQSLAEDKIAYLANNRVEFSVVSEPGRADVNGDGLSDLLVVGTLDDVSTAFLGAYDGRTLTPLWASTPRPRGGQYAPVVASNDRAYLVDEYGSLTIYDLRTGRLQASATLDGGLDMCVAPDGTVWVQTGSTFARETGRFVHQDLAQRAEAPRPDGCRKSWRGPRHDLSRSGGMEWTHFESEHALFAFATDEVAHDPARTFVRVEPKRGKTWQAPYWLPGEEAKSRWPAAYGLDPERYYFAYRLSGHERRTIGARSLETGELLWTVHTNDVWDSVLGTLTPIDDRLVLMAKKVLAIHSTITGEELARIEGRDVSL